MISSKYVEIDKSILTKGMLFEFDIFIPSYSSKEIKLFKNKNSTITGIDTGMVRNTKAFYIRDSEYENYKICLENTVDDSDTKEAESLSFAKKSASIYSNATKTLDELFNNPETLANYENSKKIVDDLVDNILHDEFTLKSLMSIAEHDFYTHTHSLNVAIYSMSLGAFLNLDNKSLAELGESALLHDLGKSKICPTIINKIGALDDKEWKKMLAHSSLGYTIGRRLGMTNKKVLDGIKYHHEKMDGTGYPDGLAGSGIPLYARIIGLCDIFDALTSKRSYKEAMTTFDALKLIKVQMNKHVDLQLLNSMVLMFR